jgi:[acyl-carrier-protein] S-malonyltransferase
VNYSFLFPGQASQQVGMGYDFFQETEIGKNYFNLANEVLNYDIQDIIFNGPDDVLRQTQYTQPAIFIVSAVVCELLKSKQVFLDAAAGHSLGEYSALFAADAFSFTTGLSLVQVRAENMHNAGKISNGTMAAIIGMSSQDVINICNEAESEGIVVAANFNAPNQTVISGNVEAVKQAMRLAKESGALKVILLNVSGAFHSPLMQPAREALAEKLNSVEIMDAKVPVFANFSANPVVKADEIKGALLSQLERPVLWYKTIQNMSDNNDSIFLEVGPGKVLQGLNRRIDRSLKTQSIGNLEDFKKFEHVSA